MSDIKNLLDQHISHLQNHIEKFDFNVLDIQKKMEQMYNQAQKQLENLKTHYASQLYSMHSMLKRKRQEIIWMEYFIKFKIDYKEPDQYTSDFLFHQKMQAKLYQELKLPNQYLREFDVELRLKGEIKFENYKETLKKERERIEIAKENERKLKEELKRKERERKEREAEIERQKKYEKMEAVRKQSIEERERMEEERKQREYEESIKRERIFMKQVELTMKKELMTKRTAIGKRALEDCFEDSEILTPKQRQTLYLNVIQNIYELPNIELIENYNVSELPTPKNLIELLAKKEKLIFLFNHKDQVFGAYSDTRWPKGQNSGNKKNFIFSITKDHKMFFNKKMQDNPVYQYLRIDSLGFGRTDLTLNEDGSWSSALDCDYSIDIPVNKEEGQNEHKIYLAGNDRFLPFSFEIWHLDYSV